MHVISRKKLRQFCVDHPDAAAPLDQWYRVASRTAWPTFAAIRETYRNADLVGKFVVFNVGGNKYRLIAEVYYESETLLIRHVLTHSEYDRGKWKA